MSQLLGFTLDAILQIFGFTYIDLDHKYPTGYQLNCVHGRSMRDDGQISERQKTMNTLSTDGRRTVKPFWPPMAAGIALGLALLFTFLITGHGLGASGAATDVVAGTGLAVAPAATQANLYLASKVADGNPIGSWMTWEVLGLFIGALVAPSWPGDSACNSMAPAVWAPRHGWCARWPAACWPASALAWRAAAPAGWVCRVRRPWALPRLCSWPCFSRPA
jgi:hypothetical protein